MNKIKKPTEPPNTFRQDPLDGGAIIMLIAVLLWFAVVIREVYFQ